MDPLPDLPEETDKIFCSKCVKFYGVDEFKFNKDGKPQRTCKRHGRKRALELDDWDSFTRLLRNWNKLANQILEGSYIFDLDTLPVNFGSLRALEVANGDGDDIDRNTLLRSEVNAAMHDLGVVIWKAGGFRFRHTGTNFQSFTYKYHCSQDLMHVKNYQSTVEEEKQRDGRRMARFPCQSKLNIRPCLQSRTLSLSICHQWHIPYEDIELSPVVQEVINSLVSTKTPSEIYREIRQIPEGKPVTRHQVYYLWQKANAEIWQRDLDPFVSATMLLSEDSRYRDHHAVFTAGNLRALGFFASETIEKLRGSAPQLVMDSTFGTNSGGMDLFAVLAEVEGTGANPAQKKPIRADPGATTYILQQFLERLKNFGFNPRCVAIDKDSSEIAAVTAVWSGVKVQLCYWHVKRASSTTLHRECAAEMHTWCKERGYYRLWAYLYINWYCPEQWKLWARAADPTDIPVVKTTMIVESHWRTLKHDYLHRFNRPRVDLVVWVLTSRVLPDAVHRMKAISSGQFRIFKARWRDAFKKQWRKEACKTVDPDKLKKNTTRIQLTGSVLANPSSTVASLYAKHIVYCFELPSPDCFETVSRQTVYPFWKDEQLILRPEYAPREGLRTRKLHGIVEMQDSTLSSLLYSSESESEQDEDGDDDQEAVPMEILVAEFREVMQNAMNLFEDQVAKGNEKFVERFIASNQMNRILVEEVKRRRNMRSMPRTWGDVNIQQRCISNKLLNCGNF
ncbi:uncharacterized protein ATNIH1004_011843 [Aspergillus tanneri]|uniref:Uncharacterized protein n=1 Tax=Aspergillus tanneri TaxID=1220188 RepID=A0A5M9MFF5_9EURO|nr:uncharacterized protein ATNIH1004_011843 [Aspergillus tanneri]KAA8641707.1 hypothetical protein ATNIH1004_011843 [Aspergillus tanneri]